MKLETIEIPEIIHRKIIVSGSLMEKEEYHGQYPPTNNPIVKGKWWDSDQEQDLQLSLDQKVASDLNLKIVIQLHSISMVIQLKE